MATSTEISVIITDKILSFLSENIWVLFLIVIIIVFHKPLSSLLGRIISLDFSYGNAKGGLKAGNPELLNKKTEEIIAVKKNISEEDKSKEEKIEEDENKENWFSDMHTAFVNKEYDKATSIFEDYIKTETDNDKKISSETLYLYFLYIKTGEKSALERLKRLIETSKTEKQKSEPLFWLAACYKFSKNYIAAEKLWIVAIDEAKDKEEQTEYICNLSGIYKSNNQLDKASSILETRLKNVSTDQEKSALYKNISEIEKERGHKQISAIALEKALELTPDDKELLFNCAYAQSEAGLEYLAINNYDTLINLDPDHSTAFNNLGVAAESLGVATKAIEFFKKSVENGNTLAMANLSLHYLNNGFLEDAKKIIKIAQECEEPHENVPQILTKINSKQENDKKTWNSAVKKGNEHRIYIRQYTKAYFNENNELLDFSGIWNIDSQNQVEIKVHKSRLTAEWLIEQTGLHNTKFKYSLSGTIHNNSALVTYKKDPLDKTSLSMLSAAIQTDTNECFAYIEPDKNAINIMSKDPKKDFVLKLEGKTI